MTCRKRAERDDGVAGYNLGFAASILAVVVAACLVVLLAGG